jgi:predicted O-linked N-acetylglucosamine transferase (SPINDLY family)
VQGSWLGYAGTTAAPFIDYVIADRIVAPDAAPFGKACLSAQLFLSPRYQPRARQAPSRAEAGLPQDAFVFCSFNNNWKLTEPVFALWMRLLAAVPDSVLWLKQAGGKAKANLLAAPGAGIDRIA